MLERAWEVPPASHCRLHHCRPVAHTTLTHCPLDVYVQVTGSVRVDRTARRTAVDAVRALTMNNKATLCRDNGDFHGT
jgi:hypothetical protein